MSRNSIHRVTGFALRVVGIGLGGATVVGTIWAAWSVKPATGAIITAMWVVIALAAAWVATEEND